MQERRVSGLGRYIKGGIHKRRDSGPKGFKTGGIQDWRET